MKVRQFRANLKANLDEAASGKPVIIERGELRFMLKMVPENTGLYEKGVHIPPEPQKRVREPLRKPNIGSCEHYQPKGSCLVKGCKFGRL